MEEKKLPMKESFVITSKYEEWALVFVYNETNQN